MKIQIKSTSSKKQTILLQNCDAFSSLSHFQVYFDEILILELNKT